MQELEKILEEIDGMIESYKENPRLEIVDICCGLNQAKRIIRKHMKTNETFEFDFSGVESFDCQCGRHYINTAINDGWIPVEERLPEAGERVIATIKHHAWISDYDQNWVPESEKTMHQEYTEPCEAIMTENGIWSYRCKEDDYDIDTASAHPGKSLDYPIAEVIAWRPLPEPYRMERSRE